MRHGKFTRQMHQMMEWVREKKRFAFFGPDYVVLGIERAEYDRLYATKTGDFNYEIFDDGVHGERPQILGTTPYQVSPRRYDNT